MSGKKVMLAGEMLWVVGTDEKENTTCEQLNFWTLYSEIPQSGDTEIRTKNQSILNGSLTAMLKSSAICHAVKGEMMVYIDPYLSY
jgi:hypothetical protein